MANTSATTMRRPSSTTPPAPTAQTNEPKGLIRKTHNGIEILFPFNIPSSPEATTVRIIKNLTSFGLYYTYFLFLILFISLIPERKVSLTYLVIMREVTCLYLFLLRALPYSFVVHKLIDKRLVLALLAVATGVELILTCAVLHLAVTLAAGIPIILVHAVFSTTDNVLVDEEEKASFDADESTPLV